MAQGVDLSGFNRKLANLKASLPGASAVALQRVMRPAMGAIIGAVAIDTHRMVRGFQIAANQARLGPFSVDAVARSGRSEQYVRKLEAQAEKAAKRLSMWLRWRDHYIQKNRTRQPYFQKIMRELDASRRSSAAWVYERVLEEIRKYAATEGTGVVIENRGRAVSLTVRDKVYGGSGAMVLTPTGVYVIIRNLEPHAIIQERRRRTVSTVLKGAKKAGSVRAAKGEMLGRLKAKVA